MNTSIRKTILCAMLALVGIAANAQVKEFERYSNAKNMTYVYVSSYMLHLAGTPITPSVPGMNIKALMDKLKGIQIISSEDPKAAQRLKSNTQAFVGNNRYEQLMQVDEDDTKVSIYYHKSKQQSVLVMINDMDGDVSVIVFSGLFALEDVMKLTGK